MAKIPLEAAIGGGYRFLFSNIISIIGIVWLPYLLLGGAAGALLWYAIGHYPLDQVSFDNDHPNIAPLIAFLRLMPAVILLLILATLIVTVGLMRKALGLMPGTTFVFFTLGAPVWRLFGAILLLGLILIGLEIACFAIAGAWVTFGFHQLPRVTAVLISVLGAVVLACTVIYTLVRLWFFLPVVVIAEERIGLGRSWQLGGGNFWRVFVVGLMVILPPLIVLGVMQNVVTTLLYGPMPIPTFAGNPHPDPKQVLDFYLTLFHRMGPAVIGGQLLIAIVIRALYAGSVATAYRGVTAAQPAE